VADRIVHQQDFANVGTDANDVSGHGTNVAGIAAGIATGANLIILKVFGDNGSGNFGVVEQALEWVRNNAAAFNIIAVNMSLGDGGNYSTDQTRYGIDDELAFLANNLSIATIVAAGNDFATHSSTTGVAYPAADASVISVGATLDANAGGPFTLNGATDNMTDVDRVAAFSQRHAVMLDVMAPGASITSAGLHGGTSTYRGTSQAAPHVAAAVALMQDMRESQGGTRLTTAELIDLFRDTGVTVRDGDDEDDNVTNTNLDFQRLNVEAAAYRVFEPGAPDLTAASDSGPVTVAGYNTDNYTNVRRPTFTGTAPVGSHVWLYRTGAAGPIANAPASAVDGQYTIQVPTDLAHETYEFRVRVAENSTIAEDNKSAESDRLIVTIDIVAPAAPTNVRIIAADDTGLSNSDGITRINNSRFSGTAEPNSTVGLVIGAPPPVATGPANASGDWQLASPALNDNNYVVRTFATDLAGNNSAFSTVLPITIDTQGPRADIVDVVDRSATLSSATIRFTNETLPVTGFEVGDLRLIVNGSSDRLAGTGATLNNTGGANYTLGSLTSATDSAGAYTLSFASIASSGITDRAGNAIASGDVDAWTQTLTYSTQGAPVRVRVGSLVVTGTVDTTNGVVTMEANQTSITKTGGGKLIITNVTPKGATLRYNNHGGTTQFDVDTGTATAANWTLSIAEDSTVAINSDQHMGNVTNNGTLSLMSGSSVFGAVISGEAPNIGVDDAATIKHNEIGTDVPVSITIGGATISGTTTGVVTLIEDTSGTVPKLLKFGSGTFKLTSVSHPTVAVNFVNEEGKTEFRTNTGNVAQTGGVNWSVTVNDHPGSAQSSVEFYTVQNLKSLVINNDAVATIVETGGTSNVLVAETLWIDPRGTLDVKNNDVVVKADSTTKDEVYSWIFGWIGGGMNGVDTNYITNWNGYGIVSTSARAFNVTNGFDLHSVGSITNEDLDTVTGVSGSAYSTFSGKTVAPEYVLVKYSYVGDTNLDGQVTFDDYAAADAAFEGLIDNMGWITGDVDYDGDIDNDDFALIDSAFFFQGDPL
jgi:hypothetical protein